MPGFQPVPALRFHDSQFNRAQPLWSEIEVRFDIFLNSAARYCGVTLPFCCGCFNGHLSPREATGQLWRPLAKKCDGPGA
jgi:hypothetical protein